MMTDEERQKLCAELHIIAALHDPFSLDGRCDHLKLAADEIERLAKENTDLWGIIRKCQNDVLEKTRADEIERLTCEVEKLWGFIRKYQNDVLVAERERDEVLCRLKGTMQ